MSNQQRRNQPLEALLVGLVNFFRDHVFDPMRRQARLRADEGQLARLDDRLLRDIGLTRSQAHAAAHGLLRLGKRPSEDASRAPSGATAAPLAERAARG